MNWNDVKAIKEANLNKAGVSGEARKLILQLERRLNTCRNMMYSGRTWESVCESKAQSQAWMLLDRMNNGGDFDTDTAEFWNEWKAYAEASGFCADSNLGDFLA